MTGCTEIVYGATDPDKFAASQPDPEPYAIDVTGAGSVPPPEFVTETGWAAGAAPPAVAVKVSVEVESASVGAGAPPSLEPPLHAASATTSNEPAGLQIVPIFMPSPCGPDPSTSRVKWAMSIVTYDSSRIPGTRSANERDAHRVTRAVSQAGRHYQRGGGHVNNGVTDGATPGGTMTSPVSPTRRRV